MAWLSRIRFLPGDVTAGLLFGAAGFTGGHGALDGPVHAAGTPSATLGVDEQNLGAKYDATRSNITFRVYSSRATRLVLYIYREASGSSERVQYQLSKDAAQVWSATVSVATLRDTHGITGAVFYGYRAWGPNWPYDPAWTAGSQLGFRADVDAVGNRFNPNKLLIDPYAREISHDPVTPGQTDATIYASGPSYRQIDDGSRAPKGIVLAADETSVGTRSTRALKDDIVYEVHLRGLTRNDGSIPAAARGTYRGAGLKAPYLASLGVTAVEFLPVQETQNDTNDVDPTSTSGDNYWGYSTLNYFAPDRRYAADKSPGGPTREFKEMVKAYHDAGIKVLVDVVYNHTGEGGAWQAGDSRTYNLLSFRGLDNPTYYSLTSDLLLPDQRPAALLGQHRRRRELQHPQPDRAEPDRGLDRLLEEHPGSRRLSLRPSLGAGQPM